VSSKQLELVHTGIQIGNFRLDYYSDELVHVQSNLLAQPYVDYPIMVLTPTEMDSIAKTEENLRKVRNELQFLLKL
jgi:hypothetical protein